MRKQLFLTILLLIVSACTPTVVTTTATELPTPTITISPTSKPSPAPIIIVTPSPTSEPVSNDILTKAQRQHIYQESLRYIALTEDDAIRVAKSMHFNDDGHPSNMCGPLAIAILRDAGIVSKYVSLHDFWLLTPQYTEIIRTTFPPNKFAAYHFDEPINEFDFRIFPLKVGDFLYLYAGASGSFEHMLVITRVDEAGRAYSVTNLYKDDSYTIQEVMLYDPWQAGVGQFFEWTDRRNVWIGTTGFGGFDLWRPNAPIQGPTPDQVTLANQIDQTLEEAGGKWNVIIEEIDGDEIYSRRAEDRVHIASAIKVPIAMLFFKSLSLIGISPTKYQDYISVRGTGRTYSQLLKAMLVNSEEDAATALVQATRRNGLNIEQTLTEWGTPYTDIDYRISTIVELARLYEGLYSGKFISPETRAIILDIIATYTPNDDTRLGAIRALLPEGSEFYNKRGTITEERLIIGDSAIISIPKPDGKKTYIVIMFGYPGEIPTTDLKLVHGIEKTANLFWDYVNTENSGKVSGWSKTKEWGKIVK